MFKNLYLSGVLGLTLATAGAAQADTVTVDAFSLWTAEGTTIQTGASTTTFAGTLSGPYFVDTGEGPVPAGTMTCVGTLKFDQAQGRQSGAADCVLNASDGATAFATLECQGLPVIGCAGPFRFTGGTGRVEGIQGEGKIVFRRVGGEISLTGTSSAEENVVGIASWKDFEFSIPDAE